MKNLVELVKAELEASNHSEMLVGFRSLCSDESYQVGDTARNSYEWDLENDCSTFDTTGEEADGTCTIGGMVDEFDDDDEIEAKLNGWLALSVYGKFDAMLVGFEEGEYGTQDENELRIVDAKVVAVF